MENANNSKIVYINTCSSCGKSLKDEWKFCPFCKAPVETFTCSCCGREVRVNWNYCPFCKNEAKTEIKNKLRVDKCNEWLRDIFKE